MRPFRTGFARLLAGLLLVQWAMAVLPHARAMARSVPVRGIEICTHAGLRTLPPAPEDRPVAPAPVADCCLLCQSPVGPAPASPSCAARPATAFALAAPLPPAAPAPLPPRAPPQQPRAPPAA